MNPTGTKALIDIEKRTLDQAFGKICLEEARTEDNIESFNQAADSLIRLLKVAKETVRNHIKKAAI